MYISTKETYKQNTVKQGEDGYSAQRAFYVIYNDTSSANLQAALTATGVPAYGSAHPSISGLTLTEKNVEVPFENNRQVFLVNCVYSPSRKNGSQANYTLLREQKPWERGPIVSIQANAVEVPIEKDKDSTPKVIANSQGEIFDPPLTGYERKGGFTIRFAAQESKMIAAINGILALVGTTNASAFAPTALYRSVSSGSASSKTVISIGAKSYLFSGMQADGAIWTDSDGVETVYYNVTMSFTSDDIVRTVLDRGYRAKITSGGTSAFIYFKKDGTTTHDLTEVVDGSKVPTTPAPVPVFIDSNGVATLTASNAVELTFKIAAEASWAAISNLLADR